MHRFGAALRQWAAGVLTRQQIIDGFQLSGDDITQLDALRATYDGMLTGNAAAIGAKVAWLDRMEDVFLLCETGDYDEAKARAHSDSDGSEFRDRLVQRHHRDPWQHGQRDGLDFEPKVVIFWWNGRTASTDGIGRGNHYRGTSWATGASSRAMPQAEQSDDTIGQSNARNHGHRRHQIQTRSLIR